MHSQTSLNLVYSKSPIYTSPLKGNHHRCHPHRATMMSQVKEEETIEPVHSLECGNYPNKKIKLCSGSFEAPSKDNDDDPSCVNAAAAVVCSSSNACYRLQCLWRCRFKFRTTRRYALGYLQQCPSLSWARSCR